jgi:hypothetical protein
MPLMTGGIYVFLILAASIIIADSCAKKGWLLPKKSFNLQLPSNTQGKIKEQHCFTF